jgi:hypothetical protein
MKPPRRADRAGPGSGPERNEGSKAKIKRSDKPAFLKLREQQPFADADADDPLSEPEEYGSASALLGERAKPPAFGVPGRAPLRVGRFAGALGAFLVAFVEHPGFPLTNFPTPVRDALHGGLAAGLAVLAFLQERERGQPGALRALKTLSAGGLALDQLRQLPTVEELERPECSSRGRRGGTENGRG